MQGLPMCKYACPGIRFVVLQGTELKLGMGVVGRDRIHKTHLHLSAKLHLSVSVTQ